MAGIFLYAPAPIPATPSPFRGVTITLTGWNDVAITITDETSGCMLQNTGLSGFNMPPSTRYSDTSPAVNGSRYRGYVIEERDIVLPIFVWADTSSADWIDHNATFWSIFRPDELLTITVTWPDGTQRTIDARYVDDGDPGFEWDPVEKGYQVYSIKLVAEQPMWEGAAITRSWGSTVVGAGTFLPASGASYVKRIGQGSTVGTAAIANAGDINVYPVWTLTGPITSAAVGASSPSGTPGLVQVIAPIDAGDELVIDPRPGAQTAILTSTGENWVKDPSKIGDINFNGSLIPPSKNWNLAIEMVGNGTISATLSPLHFRPW